MHHNSDGNTDAALARHWLEKSVDLGEPAAIVTRSRFAQSPLAAFLEENARRWGDAAAAVTDRTLAFAADAGVDVDAAPAPVGATWPPTLRPTSSPTAPPRVTSGGAADTADVSDAADAVDAADAIGAADAVGAAGAADTDKGGAGSEEQRRGPLAGIRRFLGRNGRGRIGREL